MSGSCNCAAADPHNATPPMEITETPEGPWQRCAVDFKGPIGGAGGWYLHTLMDTYSRWPETKVVKGTAFKDIALAMEDSFGQHGVPDSILSDGGPPYTGKDWKLFAEEWGFTRKRASPEHPQANGMVERFNRNLKKVIHAATVERKDPKTEVNRYIMAYRNTPHTTTGRKPSELMFKLSLIHI